MLARIAVDASVAIKWVVDEPGSDEAALLLDSEIVAPDLICAECANILWKKVMRKNLTSEQADLAARALEGADMTIISTRSYLAKATTLAVDLGHPVYDCIYLVVAEDLNVPVVTADERLVQKLRQSSKRFSSLVIKLSDVPRLV